MRPQCLNNLLDYDWNDVITELDALNAEGAAFLLYTNKLSIIVETEYFEGCFSPKHFIVYTCDKDMEVSDNLLYIISKADRIEYKKGCTYIIFNISYVSEIPRLYSLIKNKMTDLNMPEKMEIKDHGILVEVEE